MPIYTRTGDRGKTSLFGGTRVLKSDLRVETYGTIDELNSAIGVAISFLVQVKFRDIKNKLEIIQNDLLDIGSALATPEAKPIEGLGTRPLEFEKMIDQMTADMPSLKNFILPGGGRSGAHFHLCRTQARRAERRLISLMQNEEIDGAILIYLNRLSDLFFTIARYVNFVEKRPEKKWRKK